ncbi:uncharacterized protein EURHEDRAFT_414990 [Aspergillus ruber CBS 135680]|uniref:Uncharacterized protein n=1 Tax=Aspergillus ruber (strain CBS 135680) TaxID=1388766 RepID=A0A017S8R4_ASPRC|nr:uncharacterized protein EURHEDRAFT_414990 [Aspergillus ruber CBS 135680]EYE93024.1 hypothetical protein EURHEDRAFT_414990 [Aspergillus ruber CBS 135680]
MHFSKLVPAAFLAASLPAAMAEWCLAVGSHFVNVGGGPRSSPGSTFDRLQIYNENGDEIYLVETPEWGTGLCTDLYTATAGAMGMKDDFSWGASCAAPGKIKECHGASGAATHIEGEDPDDVDIGWYGIGTGFQNACMVQFECFPA